MMPFEVVWAMLFILVGAAFIWQFMNRSEARSFTTDETLGRVDAFEVGLAHDAHRRLVGVTILGDRSLHTYLTPSQARLMAEWLRLAATPVRTVADARRRSHKVPT